ncbi:hypothetical protein ACHAXR_006515 [Thalassiosira sp. AJA248-18]
MPLPPPPANLLAQLQSKTKSGGDDNKNGSKTKANAIANPFGGGGNSNNALLAAIQSRQQSAAAAAAAASSTTTAATNGVTAATKSSIANAAASSSPLPPGKLFIYNQETESFQFDTTTNPAASAARLAPDMHGNPNVDIIVPLAPCVYRMTDYTYSKREPILLSRCVNKLGVLRCLLRECGELNALLWSRLSPRTTTGGGGGGGIGGTMEESELGKARFMELLSNCGVYQEISDLIVQRCNDASDRVAKGGGHVSDGNGDGDEKTNNSIQSNNNKNNPYCIPQIRVDGLASFLQTIEDLVPSLSNARLEITNTQTVSFHPGLGELFSPGARLICHPDGMEGSPLGVSVVQSWYDEELNRATNKVKRRFILVVEFIVSVGTELVFVAASEVYPEFHDVGRNVPVRDLNHRRIGDPSSSFDENNKNDNDSGNKCIDDDTALIQRLQDRGEFYASVATDNHYLEYHPNAFFPIIGGWGNNAVRPLSKSGRVMVDVRRGFMEGHVPIRGSSDGMSDTVKEAMKLFDQSKRTGVAVPFRTAILPEFGGGRAMQKGASSSSSSKDGVVMHHRHLHERRGDSDRHHLWMAWPMLTGFSFTARCWGKLLLSLPKMMIATTPSTKNNKSLVAAVGSDDNDSPIRPSTVRMGVEKAALGGVGHAGNVNYIKFQEKAFDQLVLAEDKKELIRAVARNAGGGSKYDFDDADFSSDEDDEDDDEIGLDVVANKGAASIFLLSGPPGCGKTLTAEAIAELLKKPLYVVTAGDLGITAAEVEKSFGSVLDLCSTWDALVLVDEADIFLEARSSIEIQRNALVCVMLRLLEYYYGCLFLSSNRDAKTIDAAIASRITVMLSYPPLDVNGRTKVWKNLVELVPACPVDSAGQILPRIATNRRKVSKFRMDFTIDDYHRLASGYMLNGRQIKNSIVLARALARERGVPLSLDVLKRAVTAVAGDSCHLESEET